MTWPFGALQLAALRRLASSPSSALEIGKAAEHLVCADLMLSGYRAFLSDQGLPYDLLVDLDGRIVRVQVKATCFARNISAAGRNQRIAYTWHVRARGKARKGERLDASHCDVVALVALDLRAIAYLPISICGQTVQLAPPSSAAAPAFRSGSRWARTVADFPFAEAVGGDLASYKAAFGDLTRCIRGHEFTPENTSIASNGSRVCRACRRESGLRYQQSKEAARVAAE
jgi:hypothetical protein